MAIKYQGAVLNYILSGMSLCKNGDYSMNRELQINFIWGKF